jgi:puromycin-sensitive aminopeptidase
MSSTTTQFTRLPSNVTPVNYSLELQPDLNTFTFTGKAVIDVKVFLFNAKIFKNEKIKYLL